MDRNDRRQNARRPAYNPSSQAETRAISDELPVIHQPTPPDTPPNQKRGWVRIARNSKPRKSTKAPRTDSSTPSELSTASGGPLQGSNLTDRRRSSGGRGRSAPGGGQSPSVGGRPSFTPFRETTSYDKRRWPNDTFVPGTIISASHYEEYIDLDPTSHVSPIKANGQPELCPFTDPRGNQVCLKQRIMIVVHAFDDTYVAVPAYSYGGTGLQHMKGAKLAKHLDFHDHRRVPVERVRQNNNPPLLTKQMQPWCDLIVRKSAIHFAYPVSVPYRIKVALLGQLTDESTRTLLRFYYRSVPSAFLPRRTQ